MTSERDRACDGLAAVACLRDLRPEIRESLASVAKRREFRRGDVIAVQDEARGGLFAVERGSVRLSRLCDNGREQSFELLGPGSCFCLSPCHADIVSPVSAECATDVSLLILDRENLVAEVGNDASFFQEVVRCLASRLSGAMARATTEPNRSVRERLTDVLVELGEQTGVATDDGIRLDGLTHEQLAAHVGSAREVVSRTLRKLADDGLVKLSRSSLLLTDLPRLSADSKRSVT